MDTRWLLAGLAGVVILMALGATWSFNRSQHAIERAHARFSEQGAGLSVDDCVEEVLDWREGCDAMSSLCDSNIERMMYACLTAQRREAYCGGVGGRLSDSHIAAEQCQAHDIDRSERKRWKRCGMVYRAVDLHCKELGKELAGRE